MVLPSLETIILHSRQQIAAATEDLESFFSHCKNLKTLGLHGVFPQDGTLNWIPRSVTELHLLATYGVILVKWIETDENSLDVVTTLPNVTELFVGGFDMPPPPLRIHRLSLPNLDKLIVRGASGFKFSYLDSLLQQYSRSVQHLLVHGIPYSQLAPIIGKILPLQTLEVLSNRWVNGDNFGEGFLRFVSELHDVDTAILKMKKEVGNSLLIFYNLCESGVKQMIESPGDMKDMNCFICYREPYRIFQGYLY
uniref:ARAD1D25410p n=1 Tax=Blastobotrys adeninivorans TaxID=409370 RepID=A0A060TB62_BLAAD